MDQRRLSSPNLSIQIDIESSSDSLTNSSPVSSSDRPGQTSSMTASSTLYSIPSTIPYHHTIKNLGDHTWCNNDDKQIGRFVVRTFNHEIPEAVSSVYSTLNSRIPSNQDEYDNDDNSVCNEDLDMEDVNANNIVPYVEEKISRLRNEVVRMKNFNNEVRAGRDVKSFLDNPCVLLDVNGDSVEEIIDKMLTVGL